jgi:hypothetical protein
MFYKPMADEDQPVPNLEADGLSQPSLRRFGS